MRIINTALVSFSFAFLGATTFACSDVGDDDLADGAGGDGDPGAGGGANLGAGGGANPGAGGGANLGAGGGANPGAGGGANPGAGGGANPGAGGGANPGAGGGANPGAGGGSNPGAGGGEGAGGSPVVVDKPGYTVSGDGVEWTEGDLVDSTGSASITVNASDEKQDWHGFGGTYNEKGWDALMALSQEDRDRAIRLLFSHTEGAGFAYGRIPIGSSDYGLDRYSLNETANDFEMNSFSIDRDREALIPYIKASLDIKPDIKFWASPWSPPTWMKDNGQFDKGNMKGDAQTLQAHALYLARFVEEYALEGIDVLAVHPQNEPGFPQDYPSCLWSASVMTDYIGNYMGPTFEDRGITAEIWLGTMSNTTSDSIVTSVMGNAKAAGYVRGIGAQWGMRQNIARYKSSYGVPTQQTEHQCGNNPWEGGYQQQAPNDYAYALEGWNWIVDWLDQGVSSYLAWNMVLDTDGRSLDNVRPWSQNALLIVNRGSKTLNITPTFQMFRHLSQFTSPGGKVVGVSGDAIAFKNPDGSLAVIIHNGSSTQTMTVSGNGRTVDVEVPGRGFATVNFD